MARLLLLLFLFVMTLLEACKKDVLHVKRVQQLNSNTNSQLNHIMFLSDSVCIIAGGIQWKQSEIVRSTDGGYTWAANSYSSATIELFGLGLSSNGYYLCACGAYGNVLHSKDSGKTWQYNRIGDYLNYVGGTFPTPDTGIFVSTVLQRQCAITRVDSNFNILDEQTFLFGLNNIYMVNSSVGYVIGYGTVMKTTDCGSNWVYQNVSADNFEAMDIHGDEIWMCGYRGSVYHTIDGGGNWKTLRNGNDVTLPLYTMMDIKFRDERNGWAVCDNGKIVYTDDGGNHWAEYEQFTTSSLRSIALCPNGDLLIAGDNGAIYRLTTK